MAAGPPILEADDLRRYLDRDWAAPEREALRRLAGDGEGRTAAEILAIVGSMRRKERLLNPTRDESWHRDRQEDLRHHVAMARVFARVG